MTTDDEPEMAYIARPACGCICLATVDSPGHKRDVAREVGKAVRGGLRVERVTVAYVRSTPWRCAAHPLEENRAGREGGARR